MIPKTTIMNLEKCFFRSKRDKNPKRNLTLASPKSKHNHQRQEDNTDQSPSLFKIKSILIEKGSESDSSPRRKSSQNFSETIDP